VISGYQSWHRYTVCVLLGIDGNQQTLFRVNASLAGRRFKQTGDRQEQRQHGIIQWNGRFWRTIRSICRVLLR